jgi:hypothetical protein
MTDRAASSAAASRPNVAGAGSDTLADRAATEDITVMVFLVQPYANQFRLAALAEEPPLQHHDANDVPLPRGC